MRDLETTCLQHNIIILGIRIHRILPRAENKIENNYSPAALETPKYTCMEAKINNKMREIWSEVTEKLMMEL